MLDFGLSRLRKWSEAQSSRPPTRLREAKYLIAYLSDPEPDPSDGADAEYRQPNTQRPVWR